MAKPETIKPGYLVAMGLVQGTAPDNCYIGLVQAADEYGLRVSFVGWDEKSDSMKIGTEDLFVTWESINSILVCTENEPPRQFLKNKAPKWKADLESMDMEG